MKGNREVPDEFGVALKHFLEKRKMNITQLAEVTGVSKGYISRLINGNRKAPSVPITISFIKALAMPTKYLLKVLELEDGVNVDGKSPELYDLILFSDFTLEGESVETEVKEVIVDILQSITSCEWQKEDVVKSMTFMASIAGKIQEFKEQTSA